MKNERHNRQEINQKTLREIIQETILQHTFGCDCLCCRKDGKLDSAISEIKPLLKEKLFFIDKQSWDRVFSFHPDSEDYIIAYKNAIIKSQVITEIEKRLEEL